MLQTLDFEDLAAMGMGTSYTFQVEAVDQGGVTPPGLATVTVRITVRAPRIVSPRQPLGDLFSLHLSSLSLRGSSSGSEYVVTH